METGSPQNCTGVNVCILKHNAELCGGVFVGGMIGLTREIVLRHRAKKMAKVKGK